MAKINLISMALLVTLALIGCKNRINFIEGIPTTPGVHIKYNSYQYHFYRDTVKLTSDYYNKFPVDLVLSSNDVSTQSLTYRFVEGKAAMVYRADTLRDSLLPFFNNVSLVTFVPSAPGLSRILFTLTDKLRNKDIDTLELLTVTNLLPVATLSVSPVLNVSPYEYLLDASKSFDPDAHFGGGIVSYTYQVEGQTIVSFSSQIKHIFSGPGVYSVSVQAKDNENGLSMIATVQVTLQ